MQSKLQLIAFHPWAALKMRGAYVGTVTHGTEAHQTVLGISLSGTCMDPVLLQASTFTPVVAAQNNVLWNQSPKPQSWVTGTRSSALPDGSTFYNTKHIKYHRKNMVSNIKKIFKLCFRTNFWHHINNTFCKNICGYYVYMKYHIFNMSIKLRTILLKHHTILVSLTLQW